MAQFEPSKKTANDFNGGNEYINGDGITTGDIINAEAINGTIEGLLYAQDTADSAKDIAQAAKDLIESVVQGVSVPPAVGLHHIQYNGEPTPAAIWAGTTWEIDTAYQGRTIIGSGGNYALGEIGGEATHTLTVDELATHAHQVNMDNNSDYPIYIINNYSPNIHTGTSLIASRETTTSFNIYGGNVGGSQPHNNMPPYAVVNYWKRTA